MSTDGSKKAILAAFGANMGLAFAKFGAFAVSGSSSMLAEGVHSVADSSNQLLLLLGQKRAKKQASPEHPFGYGRERYLYSFLVAIVLFTVGGLFSINEGVSKLQNPHGMEMWWIPVIVLVIGIILEGASLRVAMRESLPGKGTGSWMNFVRRAKSPELPVILLEDFAALVGLVFALAGVSLTALTGNGVFDAIGTLAIGALLIAVAIILGVETKSLLVGEGTSAEDAKLIEAAILDGHQFDHIVHLKTLYLGPDEVLVAAKVAVTGGDRTLAEITVDTDEVEARIRAAVPAARVIYLEAAAWVPERG